MRLVFFGSVLVFTLLSGCSTMDAQDCQTANWRIIGMKDGEKGELPSTVGNYIEQCREFGVSPNIDEYEQGYQQGLQLFCTTENGFEQGKRDQKNNGICPKALQVDFNEGYRIGSEYYLVNAAINSLQANIRSNEKKIARISEQLAKEKEAVKSSDDIYEATDKYLESYETQQKEIAKLEQENKSFAQQLAVKQFQYQELVKKYGYR